MIDKKKLSQLLLERLGDLLRVFGADSLDSYGGRTCCIVHGGNNRSALSIQGESSDYPGSWVCWTNKCNETFGYGLFNLVRGALSHQELGWMKDGDEEFSARACEHWCLDFLETTPLEVNKIALKNVAKPHKKVWTGHKFTRKVLERSWRVPSPYYSAPTPTRAAYGESTLDRYCIGDCHRYDSKFFKRAIIPIFDANQAAVAFTARSILNQCKSCLLFHMGDCPASPYPNNYKWYHENLCSNKMLYNFHQNEQFFKDQKYAIIFESPGNSLRCEDAGIPGSVATFGAKIGEPQLNLLLGAGVERLILLFDSDEAGISGANRIVTKYQQDINFIIPNLELPKRFNGQGEAYQTDLGDFPSAVVGKNLRKVLRRYGLNSC